MDERQYSVDGELLPASEATVNVDDRGFRYGDAAFETMRAYGGSVFEWDAHADRLADTCEALGLDHGLSRGDLHSQIGATLEANDLEDAYVRLSITRGVQPGTLTPRPDVDPTVVVVVKPLPRGGVAGESVWERDARAQTTKTRRIPDNALPAGAKTHNYLNGILAREELYEADEALMRDQDGYVAEGATSNLFFVTESGIHTPTTEGPVLPGITRRVVCELAEEAGVPIHDGRYTVDDVRNADEAFFTNTTWEIRPIRSLDGLTVGGGPVTDLLTRLFDERIEREHY